MKSIRSIIICMLIILLACPIYAAEYVTCYTMWDDFFLYAAFDVQDTDVISTNTTHMSSPWDDDAVEVFLETDYARAVNRSPQTYQMSVSAGGGSSFLIGMDGLAAPKKIFTFKYASEVQGVLNSSSEKDIGYIIELAMPWSEMGGPPKPGDVMGFNIINRVRGEADGFASLSRGVTAVEDIQVPTNWGKIKFVDTPTVLVTEDGAVVCRKVMSHPPVIDGNLSKGEWIRDMSFRIAKPEPSPEKAAKQRLSVERLVFALYYLHDSTSIEQYKYELSEMARTGIDAAVIMLDEASTDKSSLHKLVDALNALKSEGRSCPMITACLTNNRDALRTFIDEIPENLLLGIQLFDDVVLPVFVKNGSKNVEALGDCLTHRKVFALRVDSEMPSGSITLKTILVGYESDGQCEVLNVGILDVGGNPRPGIESYKKLWQGVIEISPNWVLVDSWNNLEDNSAICPSVEGGTSYADAAKLAILRFNGMLPYNAKYLRHDTPSRMSSGGFYQINLTIKNTGTKPWYARQGFYIAPRWYQDGALFADTGLRLPIQDKVLALQTMEKTVGINVVDQDGQPLPCGEYELRWDMVHGRDEWFSNNGDMPLIVPVSVTE